MQKTYIALAVVIIAVGGYFFLSGAPPESAPADTPDAEMTVATTDTTTMDIATLQTSMGVITLQLFREQAPKTVENFVKLAQAGFYDGTRFHRVIRGFMIQGGDPLTKDQSKAGLWGTGGPGYAFADEIGAENRNLAGTISMANAGPNTNGSQFFINAVDNRNLDAKHTVFGKVTAGMEVVRAIESVQTDGQDRPVTGVIVQKVTMSAE